MKNDPSPTVNPSDSPISDEEMQEALVAAMRAKIAEARLRLPGEWIAVSGSRRRTHANLIFVRAWMTIAGTAAIVGVSVALATTSTVALFFSAILAICLGLGTAALVIGEVFLNAGDLVETQWKRDEECKRTATFVSSTAALTSIIWPAATAVAGDIIGFAGVYRFLSMHAVSAFASVLSPISAVYFSTVTFATVGYGDIAPVSSVARFTTVIQIASGFVITVFVIAILVAWVLSHHQKLADQREESLKGDAQEREEAIKAAGLGVYGDSEALQRAALEYIASKRRTKAPPNVRSNDR